MPRRFIRRYLPHHRTFRDHPHLRRFGVRLQDPNLWHLNRRSVSGGVGVGLFCALLPVPFQMLFGAAFAILLRVNLPISVVLVWLTNPLTMAPVFYVTYLLGCWLLGVPTQNINLELGWESLLVGMQDVWKPLLVGSLFAAVVAGLLGFALVRLAWRIYLVRQRGATLARMIAYRTKRRRERTEP